MVNQSEKLHAHFNLELAKVNIVISNKILTCAAISPIMANLFIILKVVLWKIGVFVTYILYFLLLDIKKAIYIEIDIKFWYHISLFLQL